ncbi:MAG: phytanoyl-CoA dioxygenase family protein [Nannocystaceae bacterium]
MLSPLSSAHERAFADLDERGYGVFHGVVTPPQADRTVDEIKGFLAAEYAIDFRDPTTWGSRGFHRPGFVEVYNRPTMWENRQDPGLYAIFARVLGTERLWVTLDRAGFKRPGKIYEGDLRPRLVDKPEWGKGLDVHTDVNPWHLPSERRVQGILALGDTTEDQGGFACVPGFHREIEAWAAAHPEWAAPPEKAFVRIRDQAMIRERLTPIPMKKGDLLVFDSRLPHGSTRNETVRWRVCQYITLVPAIPANQSLQANALRGWATGERPTRYPGGSHTVDAGPERERCGTPPPLTPLGARLVGIEPWD